MHQWLNVMVGRNTVEDVYKGPRGFIEVIFRIEEQRDRLLSRIPVFVNNKLVYIVPWRPLAELEEILKQKCPIWVEADVTLVPHVVAYAAFLRRFVEDPPTTIDFVVPKQGTSLSSIPTPKKRIDILER